MALRVFAVIGAVALMCVIGIMAYSYELLGESKSLADELAQVQEEHAPFELQETERATSDPSEALLATRDAAVEPLLGEDELSGLPADDPAGLVLYGVLLDEQGARIEAESMSVRLTGPANANRWMKLDDGTFAYAGLSPGAWTLTASATGYDETVRDVELGGLEPVTRVELVMTRAVMLHVRLLTPEGESLQAALDDAASSPWDSVSLSVVGTRDRPASNLPLIGHRAYSRYGIGRYTSQAESFRPVEGIREGYDGFLQLSESLPAWVSLLARHVVLDSQLVPPGSDEVVFVLTPEQVQSALGTLSLRVVDSRTGAPIPDARVGLSTSQSSGGGTPVDTDGRLELKGQLPGLLDLRIRAPGYGTRKQVVSLPSGRPLDLGDVPLDPSTSIRGVIVDENGTPLPHVGLRAHPLEGFSRDYSLVSRHSYRSDEAGHFEIPDQGRQQVVLTVIDKAWAGLSLVDAREGDVENAVLVASAATAVTLVPGWSEGVTRSVTLYDAAGTPLSAWAAYDGAGRGAQRLAPGEYQLVIDGGKPVTFEVGTEPMELALQP